MKYQNKLNFACNNCRIKKIKCDGRSPCSRCVLKKIECLHSFSAPKTKKRKQKQVENEEIIEEGQFKFSNNSKKPKLIPDKITTTLLSFSDTNTSLPSSFTQNMYLEIYFTNIKPPFLFTGKRHTILLQRTPENELQHHLAIASTARAFGDTEVHLNFEEMAKNLLLSVRKDTLDYINTLVMFEYYYWGQDTSLNIYYRETAIRCCNRILKQFLMQQKFNDTLEVLLLLFTALSSTDPDPSKGNPYQALDIFKHTIHEEDHPGTISYYAGSIPITIRKICKLHEVVLQIHSPINFDIIPGSLSYQEASIYLVEIEQFSNMGPSPAYDQYNALTNVLIPSVQAEICYAACDSDRAGEYCEVALSHYNNNYSNLIFLPPMLILSLNSLFKIAYNIRRFDLTNRIIEVQKKVSMAFPRSKAFLMMNLSSLNYTPQAPSNYLVSKSFDLAPTLSSPTNSPPMPAHMPTPVVIPDYSPSLPTPISPPSILVANPPPSSNSSSSSLDVQSLLLQRLPQSYHNTNANNNNNNNINHSNNNVMSSNNNFSGMDMQSDVMYSVNSRNNNNYNANNNTPQRDLNYQSTIAQISMQLPSQHPSQHSSQQPSQHQPYSNQHHQYQHQQSTNTQSMIPSYPHSSDPHQTTNITHQTVYKPHSTIPPSSQPSLHTSSQPPNRSTHQPYHPSAQSSAPSIHHSIPHSIQLPTQPPSIQPSIQPSHQYPTHSSTQPSPSIQHYPLGARSQTLPQSKPQSQPLNTHHQPQHHSQPQPQSQTQPQTLNTHYQPQSQSQPLNTQSQSQSQLQPQLQLQYQPQYPSHNYPISSHQNQLSILSETDPRNYNNNKQ